MAYTPEQVIEVKRQIFNQTKDLPEDQRKAIEEQVNVMSPEQLEEFVKKQMQGQGQQGGESGEQKGIFRMIVDGDVPSKKIEESDDAIVVVSKRAVSKGHVLVIPKKVVSDEKKILKSVVKLADKVEKRMKSKLKAKEIRRENTKAFGEVVIDLIPDYGDGVDKGKAYEASEEEMQEIEKALWMPKPKPKPKVVKVRKKAVNAGKPIKLKRHIP